LSYVHGNFKVVGLTGEIILLNPVEEQSGYHRPTNAEVQGEKELGFEREGTALNSNLQQHQNYKGIDLTGTQTLVAMND
jgi:hypothetical protein